MKKIISFIIAAIMALSASYAAQAYFSPDEYPDFDFETDYDDTYSVYKYRGTDSEVTVPEYLYSKLVKRVDKKAFANNSTMTSLVFHDQMTNIRQWAVRGCANLETVYYSKSFTYFEKYAFAYDKKLSDALLFGTSLTDIENNCYDNDSALRRVSFPSTLKNLGSSAFSATALRTVVIPDGVVKIDSGCFAKNSSLKKIYIPDSVTTIGANVFDNSPNVKVYTTEGSVAQSYCETNSIPFETVSAMPGSLLGDVNFDGAVNDRDISVMQSELNNEDVDFNSQNCDMNGDCRFDVNDVTLLQNKLRRDYTIVYNYNHYTSADESTPSSRSKKITTFKSSVKEIAEEYYPMLKSPYVTYSIGNTALSGDTIEVTINDEPKYYTVEFNSQTTRYRYKDVATLTSDTDCYFVTNGRAVARGTSYSFYVTNDSVFTSSESASTPKEDIVSIDFNSYQLDDERVTVQLLATADVGSFKRMGTAFALSAKTKDELKAAIAAVENGTSVSDNVAVHNSKVSKANISGQYQFIYEPYSSLENAKKYGDVYFYTFAETADGEILISDEAKVNMNSVLV